MLFDARFAVLNVVTNTFIDNYSLIFHGMRLRLVGIVALLLLTGPAKAVSIRRWSKMMDQRM